MALAAAQLAALYMVGVAKRNFGGATGDGIGATNEVARVVALALTLTLGGDITWMLW
ncbi:MAG: adenosylcobinamide-GDP ribazoletransferase [Methanothrix sp.]|nr:adenosylcobinamide-GDP ribazoletransferase [Methanothrix sp.]